MIKIKEKTWDEQQYIRLMNNVSSVRRKIAIGSGVVLITAGVVTLPVPCGSMQMIGLGGLLISNPKTSIKKLYNKTKWNIITKIKMRKNK